MTLAFNSQTKVLEELILNRRTVHRYTEEQIPEDFLKRALKDSLWVPNHKLTFPWAFSILNASQRDKLADVAVAAKSKKSEISEIKKKALRDKITQQGSLILVCRKTNQDIKDDGTVNDFLIEEDRATMACSIMIFSLLLQSEAYHSKWSTSGYLRSEAMDQAFDLKSKQLEVTGVIYCGRVFGDIPEGTPRPDLDDILF